MGDREYAEQLGLQRLPEGDFVLPVIEGHWIGKWMVRGYFGNGGCSTMFVDTEDEGRREVELIRETNRRFWLEKIEWRKLGDRCDAKRPILSAAQEAVIRSSIDVDYEYNLIAHIGPRNVLRIEGRHYTVRTFGMDAKISQGAKGFGGQVLHWRWLDEPEHVVHVSDDVFTQGEIPEEFRADLPDNAEWTK